MRLGFRGRVFFDESLDFLGTVVVSDVIVSNGPFSESVSSF